MKAIVLHILLISFSFMSKSQGLFGKVSGEIPCIQSIAASGLSNMAWNLDSIAYALDTCQSYLANRKLNVRDDTLYVKNQLDSITLNTTKWIIESDTSVLLIFPEIRSKQKKKGRKMNRNDTEAYTRMAARISLLGDEKTINKSKIHFISY